MNTENPSIHQFDINLICEYFSTIKRQGPGDEEFTKLALQFIEYRSEQMQIADIGCGTGGQTITLAQNTSSHIVAVDLFPKFLEILNENAQKHNLSTKITTLCANMMNLPFQEEQFDVIWSEGAIYNIGFAKGLAEWKKFLKKDGYIVISEPCWVIPNRPKEIEQFWNDAYPEIDSVSSKIKVLERCGYYPIAHFLLPDYCWTKNFYEPQQYAQQKFIEKYTENPIAQMLIKNQQQEAEYYRKYGEYYGYVFFIGRKR